MAADGLDAVEEQRVVEGDEGAARRLHDERRLRIVDPHLRLACVLDGAAAEGLTHLHIEGCGRDDRLGGRAVGVPVAHLVEGGARRRRAGASECSNAPTTSCGLRPRSRSPLTLSRCGSAMPSSEARPASSVPWRSGVEVVDRRRPPHAAGVVDLRVGAPPVPAFAVGEAEVGIDEVGPVPVARRAGRARALAVAAERVDLERRADLRESQRRRQRAPPARAHHVQLDRRGEEKFAQADAGVVGGGLEGRLAAKWDGRGRLPRDARELHAAQRTLARRCRRRVMSRMVHFSQVEQWPHGTRRTARGASAQTAVALRAVGDVWGLAAPRADAPRPRLTASRKASHPSSCAPLRDVCEREIASSTLELSTSS